MLTLPSLGSKSDRVLKSLPLPGTPVDRVHPRIVYSGVVTGSPSVKGPGLINFNGSRVITTTTLDRERDRGSQNNNLVDKIPKNGSLGDRRPRHTEGH